MKNSKAKIELLGSYDPEKQLIIEDPYYVSTAPARLRARARGACPAHAALLSPPRRAMTPTSRPCTSSACGAAEPSWTRRARRGAGAARGGAAEASAVTSADPPFRVFKIILHGKELLCLAKE